MPVFDWERPATVGEQVAFLSRFLGGSDGSDLDDVYNPSRYPYGIPFNHAGIAQVDGNETLVFMCNAYRVEAERSQLRIFEHVRGDIENLTLGNGIFLKLR